MIKVICHQLIKWSCWKNHQRFIHGLKTIEHHQRKILFQITGIDDYEFFKKKYTVTNYNDWSDIIESRRVTEKHKTQFVPTSGSTQKIKWIPYTTPFKNELWRATSPWLYDIYQRYPLINKGTHFWSLSWLPEEMRLEYKTNDLDFFSGIEKKFLVQVMTMSKNTANAPTLHDSMKQALISLLTKKVTLISIWSPTFLLELLEFLLLEKDYFLNLPHLSEKIKTVLLTNQTLTPKLTKALFPDLILISSWATSTSFYYANILKELFSHAHFEEKGLWATEGVVTIPYKCKFPLAINSHFYEFIDNKTKEVFPSWQLEIGMEVSPLLTTGSGLFRYQLNDLLSVDGFINKTPCFKFLGRINEVDLVGEKISATLAYDLLIEISNEFQIRAVSLLAFVKPHAHYMLLVDGVPAKLFQEKIKLQCESILSQHFHYKLARELHQLSECEVLFSNNAMDDYLSYSEKQIGIRGNIKLEPLLLIKG